MSRTPPARRELGFTLIELVVSITVAVILVLGAMAVLTAQQRVLQKTSADRAIQETARSALTDITENLRRAGFGMEPALVFDFGLAPTGYQAIAYSCISGGPVLCRDSIAGSDEIVFHARDPAFKAALAQAPSATQIVISGGIQLPLRSGQILQVMCAGTADWAYATVASTVPANWTPPAAPPATTTITLLSDASGFPRNNAKLAATGSCFQIDYANVRVYRIDRFRYHVVTYPDADTSLTRPYLMLDRGLLNDDGTLRDEPVAPDVDDLQFEYEFYNPTTKLTSSVGAASGVRLSNAPGSIDLAVAPPKMSADSTDPTRLTNSPANIRAVRVSIVTRSPGQDIRARTQTGLIYAVGPTLPAAGNRPQVANAGQYYRIKIDTTVQIRNMDSRAMFYDK